MAGTNTIDLGPTIAEAVKAQVQASVVAALGGQDRLLESLVHAALTQKVKDNESYRDLPFIDKVCRDTVWAATREAMTEVMAEARPRLVQLIKAELQKQKGVIAEAMVASLFDSSDRFRVSVSFSVAENR